MTLDPLHDSNVDDSSYGVAVRALCEFTAKVGDLDLRFTPTPTALEGMAGHRTVVARRGEAYQAEVALSGDYLQLKVRGRADGYDPALNQLEEIKTYRGDLNAMPANHRQLHWAQAKVYGWLLCQQMKLDEITLALVYFNIVSEQETLFRERYTANALHVFSTSNVRFFCAGPSRNWFTPMLATKPWARWRSLIRVFARARERWPSRSIKRSVPAVA